MLQQMRSLAKYIWVLVALAFVGGFLLYETTGLIGRTAVTPTTAVASVNGRDILYNDYTARVQNEIQQQQQQQGRTLTTDDTRRIENEVFDQMVSDILLQQEYQRRGIFVTDDEVREFARFAPPSWITSAPELQTEGRFDPAKYQRLLASPQAREGGLLLQLEGYYRSEIPKEKLFDQIASGVYITDAELWRIWRDTHDSAQVSFVALRPTVDTTAAKSISESDLRAYFDKHKSEFEHPGRAVLSVLIIPRTISAADTAAARHRADSLRSVIVSGQAKFEDVARSVSADSGSASNGGELPRGGRGRFVPKFEDAAYSLEPGEVSAPVLTQFGFHLIRVDEKKGDTLSMRHILIPILPSDSSQSRMDAEADTLAKIAASSDTGSKLDVAARRLDLEINRVVALEDQPASLDGRQIPSVSGWAFSGARPGETSELFDDEGGYYLARLDSIVQGGEPEFDNVEKEIRATLELQRQIDQMVPRAKQVADAAIASSFEAAARKQNLSIEQTPMFTRASFVPGLGQFTRPIGAAFALPAGAISAPVPSTDGVYVLRVDKRVNADSATWAAQKTTQRSQRLQQLRQQRVQLYLQDLRKSANIDDRRKEINAAVRRTDS